MKGPIEFSLGLFDNDELGDTKFKEYISSIANKHNSEIVNIDEDGDVTFSSPDEKSAFDLVDDFYGPEDDSRDSNRFYVYGDED